MENPSLDKILETMKKLRHRVYKTRDIDWNLNIVGIRAKGNKHNKFDDLLLVFHFFLDKWSISYYPITTDPSIKYLKNPINSHGAAILKEGQYKGAYSISKHKNKYNALCQRLGVVTVYRDNNRDGLLNLDPDTENTGMFGINIHKGPNNGDWDPNNDIYSAGCQVFADSRHFNEFMLKCKNGANSFGNKFTYTLIREEDLES